MTSTPVVSVLPVSTPLADVQITFSPPEYTAVVGALIVVIADVAAPKLPVAAALSVVSVGFPTLSLIP